MASRAGLEPKADQRRDDAAAVSTEIDRNELAGLLIARYEKRLEDPQRAAALDSLQSADQPALEVSARPESVHQEVGFAQW